MLGLMYSDGCVWESKDKKGHIQLKIMDYDAVSNFKKALSSEHKIREEKDGYRIIFKSRKMFNDLVKQGCVPKKSLILDFPPISDRELIWSFIFGYIDGDGNVNIRKDISYGNSIRIYSASINLLNGIYEFLKNEGISPRIYEGENRKDNTGHIYIGIKSDLYKVLEIWTKEPVKMNRKYDKLSNYLNT